MSRDPLRTGWFCSVALAALVLSWALKGCTYFSLPPLPTSLPTEYLPTAIALTVMAGRLRQDPLSVSSTATSSPTQVALTEPATLSLTNTPTRQSPTATATAAVTEQRNTRTPTFTPTPTIPFAAIQILTPGPGSRVVSPFTLTAYLEPGAKGNISIELLGEDGRLLVRNIKSGYSGTRVYLNQEIEYEIAAVAEAGRLQISTRDEYGRVIALASVDLLLLSIGNAEINPPGDLQERIIIQEPEPKTLIQGGRLWVSGLARTDPDLPLIIELITREGKTLGPTRLVNLTESDIDGYSAFSTEITYFVKEPTWVRLTVSEISVRIPGATHFSTIEVLLSP